MAENDETNDQAGTAVADEQQQAYQYNIRVEDAGPATKKVSVEIPQDRIQQKLAEQYKELRSQAAIPGFRELRDASDAADPEQRRLGLVARVRAIGLYHSDQPMPVAQRVVHHRKITRLENVQRHLAARQQQRAGERKHRDDFGEVAGPTIFGINRHRAIPVLIA